MLEQVETRPLRSLFVLRTVFGMSGPLNAALALSPIALRDYFVGSAAGLVIPTVVMVVFFDWAF
jgi:uncharacterized membrane protein YdjX (TVP38/TMEM64 family)